MIAFCSDPWRDSWGHGNMWYCSNEPPQGNCGALGARLLDRQLASTLGNGMHGELAAFDGARSPASSQGSSYCSYVPLSGSV